ncbi:MAG: hypothetical protein IKX88_08745, partial [Thermoguttaceae bacterium]|nr:hypothetical protein [Thermoguttaceae bacterium]
TADKSVALFITKWERDCKMGVWGFSICGNDTARELSEEYPAAFYKYEPEEAVLKIDEYVRACMFDESDEEEWCNYMYSLTNYMWKKGILTDEVKEKVLHMIDSDFGLELWAEEGAKILEKRKRALAEFRAKLTSPLPPKKKIKLNIRQERIFNDGDVVAIQLQTADKPYAKCGQKTMTEEEFHSYDGKFVLLQLIDCYSSWSSAIVPEVKDHSALFRLFNGVYDDVPDDVDLAALKPVKVYDVYGDAFSCFACECSMFYFKRRQYRVIGNRRKDLYRGVEKDRKMMRKTFIFFGSTPLGPIPIRSFSTLL